MVSATSEVVTSSDHNPLLVEFELDKVRSDFEKILGLTLC